MWSPQEYHAFGGGVDLVHLDGREAGLCFGPAQPLKNNNEHERQKISTAIPVHGVTYIFHEDAAKAMGNEDDGPLKRA
jgi:hypothetical protein